MAGTDDGRTGALDRAMGALLGLAAGDAVGTTVEFEPPGSFEPLDDMVGGGPFRLAPGQWTDDTSLALCLAESLLDRDGVDLVDQMRRYLLWRDEGHLSSTGRCFDIGLATRAQIDRYRRTGQPVDPHPDEEAAGNGSIMRLAPVAIRWHADARAAVAAAAESSRTTHPARRPVDASRVLGAMLVTLIGGRPLGEVLAPGFWAEGPWADVELDPAVAAVAHGSWTAKEPPAIRGKGYCVDSLEAALWAVAGAEDFRSAVLRAANLGDDADTTAAVAGQIAGAAWGASGIPAEWRARLALGERVESLARNLFAAGSDSAGSDSSGPAAVPEPWAFDDLVHGWWVRPGRLLAGEYPGHRDAGRARLKIDVLVDAGVRTFVDLTTPEDRLEPYEPVLGQVAAARDLDLRRVGFPVPDLGVVGDEAYSEVLRILDEAARRGGVYLHCWGGVGRTATVVGCLLVDDGADYDGAMRRLGELRRHSHKHGRRAPETDVQHDVVRHRATTRPY